jgi:hypothetical protein
VSQYTPPEGEVKQRRRFDFGASYGATLPNPKQPQPNSEVAVVDAGLTESKSRSPSNAIQAARRRGCAFFGMSIRDSMLCVTGPGSCVTGISRIPSSPSRNKSRKDRMISATLIFDCPTMRSSKTMGVSMIRQPLRAQRYRISS